jgi:hypothetical protein
VKRFLRKQHDFCRNCRHAICAQTSFEKLSLSLYSPVLFSSLCDHCARSSHFFPHRIALVGKGNESPAARHADYNLGMSSSSQLAEVRATKSLRACSRRYAAPIAIGILILALVGLHLRASMVALDHASTSRFQRLLAKATLLAIRDLKDDDLLTLTVARRDYIRLARSGAEALVSRGWLRPGMIELSDYVVSDHPDACGMLESIQSPRDLADHDGRIAIGWAILPERGRPADAVILTSRGRDEKRQVVGIVPVYRNRLDVAANRGTPFLRSGWKKQFDQERAPRGTIIEAWALDVESGKAYALARSDTPTGQRL